MNTRIARARLASALVLVLAVGAREARADGDDQRYPEEVLQWGVQKGETCEDIASALYGHARYAYLLQRYNHIGCTRGAPLKEGLTLVVPAKVTEVPPAHITGLHPKVNAKAPGGSWGPASNGQPLQTDASVSTEEHADAGIQFIDRTKVFLAENTLVIIYGTASQTVVSKNAPSAIELDKGEMKAALAALRGEDDTTVDVGVTGGGQISAASKDTVVQRTGDRTTVEVFDGKAKVQNAGTAVNVPTNFGTRFVGPKPPDPPRPLPPAPVWMPNATPVVISTPGNSVLRAAWEEVPKAKAYRIEIASDSAFEQLITRREVPASVRSFEIDKLPPGSYFARVRAIDTEDYLGIATSTMRLASVEAGFDRGTGTVGGTFGATSQDAVIHFSPVAGVELAIGNGPFAPLPASLDLGAAKAAKLRFRLGGPAGMVTEMPVEYAKIEPSAPEDKADQPKPKVVPPRLRIGTSAQGTALGTNAAPLWWSPQAEPAGFVTGIAEGDFASKPTGKPPDFALHTTATGAIGRVGLELGLRSGAFRHLRPDDSGATIGGRVRITPAGEGRIQVGPALRIMFPVSDSGHPVRLEGGFGLGSVVGRWSWLVDVGTRLQVQQNVAGAYSAPGFLIGGGTLDIVKWLRAFGTLDAEIFMDSKAEPCVICNDNHPHPGGGLTMGLEAGTVFFGGLSARLSPFAAQYGMISGQATFGVRAVP